MIVQTVDRESRPMHPGLNGFELFDECIPINRGPYFKIELLMATTIEIQQSGQQQTS